MNQYQWLDHTYDIKKIKECITKIKDQFGQQFSDPKAFESNILIP